MYSEYRHPQKPEGFRYTGARFTAGHELLNTNFGNWTRVLYNSSICFFFIIIFLFFKGGVGFHYQKSRNEEPQSWLCAFHVKNWGLAQIRFSRLQWDTGEAPGANATLSIAWTWVTKYQRQDAVVTFMASCTNVHFSALCAAQGWNTFSATSLLSAPSPPSLLITLANSLYPFIWRHQGWNVCSRGKHRHEMTKLPHTQPQ